MVRGIAFLFLLLLAAPAFADNIFDLARKPRQTTLLTLSETAPGLDQLSRPPMLRRIDGILAELKPAQIIDLIACVDPHAPPEKSAAPAHRICFVHISGPAGDRTIAIDQQPDGAYIAQVITPISLIGSVSPAKPAAPSSPQHALLKPQLLDHLLDEIVGYTGTFDAPADKTSARPLAENFELPKPYCNGPFILDSKTIRDRIGSSGYIKFDPTTRKLQNEKFLARLPKNYDARRPAGLLVWVDASPSGQPPPPFFKALDEFNLICIGAADSGNDRAVTDRLQLALDAVATARRSWNIDSNRVYVTGISGGGKMASILLPCFPDVFTGAAPIVGLAIYENVPTGEGKKIWPASFTKPAGKRWDQLKQHRMAAITGSKDFNRDPVTRSLQIFQRDKLDVRLVDIEGMGHEFPSPAQFAEQLNWLDEKPAAVRKQAESDSAAALIRARESKDKAALLEIARTWPWTSAAWDAAAEIRPKPALPPNP